MKILITGGCGFLGSNLAVHALQRGDEVVIFDMLLREGSINNLQWLQTQGKFKFIQGDIRNRNDIERVVQEIQPDVIFHLAGQVAMTTSIINPRLDFEINVMGTFNLLEAVRQYAKDAIVIYSSTNKVYGDLEQYTYTEEDTRYSCVEKPNGFDELTPLEFHSPYGSSKGAADQYMLDYARIFGLKTVVFRHSSMYGGRQYSTTDQGWIGWFCMKALEQKKGSVESFTISGNGKQVRDVLHAEDMIELYFQVIKHMDKVSGQAFNIGGSAKNSLSVLELIYFLEKTTNTSLKFNHIPARQSDQRIFVADISKIEKITGWSPKVSFDIGVPNMIEWIEDSNQIK